MNIGNRIRAVILVMVMIVAVVVVIFPETSTGESAQIIPSHTQSKRVFKDSAISFEGVSGGVWRAAIYAATVAESERKEAEAKEAARMAALPKAPKIVAKSSSNVSTPSSYSGPECQYAELIRSIWTQDAEWAIGIAWRESNCTAGAASHTGCLGVFQLCWPLHADIEQDVCGRSDEAGMYDPECNIRQAWHLYQGSGGAPWS